MKVINSELKVKATAKLQAEIEEEMLIDDIEFSKAELILKEIFGATEDETDRDRNTGVNQEG